MRIYTQDTRDRALAMFAECQNRSRVAEAFGVSIGTVSNWIAQPTIGPPPKRGACLLGQRFHRLLVVEEVGRVDQGKAWRCICDCGKERVTTTKMLRNNSVRSCGCLRTEHCMSISSAGAARIAQMLYLGPQESLRRFLYSKYKFQARRRGISFSLDKETFLDLVNQPCRYCGIEPAQVLRVRQNGDELVYNGLDRVNPSKGYTVDNVVPCCWRCNVAKANHPLEEFLSWVSRIAAHQCAHPIDPQAHS